MNSLHRSLSVALVTLILVAPAVMGQCPVDPTPTISPYPPSDVCLPNNNVAGIKYFDDFSWRSFVALVWPASKSFQRGVPLTDYRPGDFSNSKVPVFQTYKADWEIFQPDGSEPSVWSSYDSKYAPCRGKIDFLPNNAFQLAAFS